MKRIMILSTIILLAASCTTRLQLPEEPQTRQYTSVVTVNIPELVLTNSDGTRAVEGDGVRLWSLSECLGVVGGRVNEKFILRKQYDGKSGLSADFYGAPQDGSLVAYFPWSETCTMEEGTVQTYCSDPYDHFKKNSVFVAEIKDSAVDFCYSGGLLSLKCGENLGHVTAVSIRTNGWNAEVEGINEECDGKTPLTVWVKIPAGEYQDFSVTFHTSGSKISIPAPGQFKVQDFCCVEVLAKEQTYHDGVDPFEGVGGEYTDEPAEY